jgi:glyoxylase-like metal-dependent hydrolase (beta-lactamase superfamily II)
MTERTAATAVQVGEVTCRILRDGHARYPTELIFAGIDRATLEAELGPRLQDGQVSSTYHCALLETPTARVLLDTGLGKLAEVMGAPAGHLISGLAAAGYAPDDIDVVLLSHAHPDHIGGLLTNGNVTFQRARHVMSAVEWGYWTSENSLSQLPEIMAAPARMLLPPLDKAGAIDLIRHDTEVVPGIHLLSAPGHTPGHCVVAVDSGASMLTLLADTIIDELQFVHQDWVSTLDHLPDQTVATRKRLLADAAANDAELLAHHIGHFGHVETAAQGYLWHSS